MRWDELGQPGGNPWGSARAESAPRATGECLWAPSPGFTGQHRQRQLQHCQPGHRHVQPQTPHELWDWGALSPSHSPCLQTAPQHCGSRPVLPPVLGTSDSCSISFICQRVLVSPPGLDEPERKQISMGALGEGAPSSAPPCRPLMAGSGSSKAHLTPCSRSRRPAPARGCCSRA